MLKGLPNILVILVLFPDVSNKLLERGGYVSVTKRNHLHHWSLLRICAL
jgi:hypothetical protein